MEHKNKFVKSLCIAAFLSILCIPQINSKAMAQAPVPTLDRLNQEGATIPDTDPPQVYPESAYTLTEIKDADPSNLPQNAIILYDKNEDGTVTPKYYLVNLKDSVKNIGQGDTTKYFEWSQNSEGRLELKEVSAPAEGKNTITVKYDTSSLLQRIPNDADKSSTNISGTFVNQTTGSTSGHQYGGAIYNDGENAKLGDINADFIGNHAHGTANGAAYGGAIANNSGTIANITGNFIGNYVDSANTSNYAGAIYNTGEVSKITGNFIGNYVLGDDYIAYGGAIYNDRGTLGDITGNFIGNYVSGSSADGGAIYNIGTIGNITGDFIGNYVSSGGKAAAGGAIYNNGGSTIGDITGDFIGNYALGGFSWGGVISNYGNANSEQTIIGDIIGNFIGNYVSTNSNAGGGVIYNNFGIIGNITGDFIGNYVLSSNGYIEGTVITIRYGTIGDITGDFISNYASSSNSYAQGGAIYNERGTIGAKDDEGESDTQLALGGAVYTRYDMNFIADNQTNYFSGNYTEDYRGKINNAIFVQTSSSSSPTIKLQAQNNGVIVFNDQIDGGVSKNNSETGKYEIDRTNAYNLALDGDSTGKVVLNNDVINANISLENTNLYLGREDVFDKSVSLSLNSGSIYLNNNTIGTMHVPTLNLNGNTNISVDADLANKSMDRITADTYNVTDGAMLNVNNVVLLSDAKEDVTNIQFADDELASNVAFTGATPIAYSPIWKYDVSYNPEDGFFSFVRGAASSGNASDAFNPSVLASPVATQAGAYTTQLQTFNYAFQHADSFMNIPYMERLSIINSGRYALSPTGDATDVGTFSPLLLKDDDAGFWVKPYASFENVPLKNGPKVSNINYGTLIGYDSPLTSVGNGFERVLTGYIGYNGASQQPSTKVTSLTQQHYP